MAELEVRTLHAGNLACLECSVFAVAFGAELMVVDPGGMESIDHVMRAIAGVGWDPRRLSRVYFTHLHFDHYRHFDWPESVRTIFVPASEVAYIAALRTLSGDPERFRASLLESHHHVAPVFLREFLRVVKNDTYDLRSEHRDPRIREIHDGFEIARGLRAVSLPGHTVELLGVLVETNSGIEILCADAVLDEIDSRVPHKRLLSMDPTAEARSREFVLSCSVVHPGHGASFRPAPQFHIAQEEIAHA